MNPYDQNAHNIARRLGVWLRGMFWLYRRPLMVIAVASVTMAVGVNAEQGADKSENLVVLAGSAN